LVRGGVASGTMLLATAAHAQDAAPKDAAPKEAAPKSVTLSESAGTSAATPVVTVKNEAPSEPPPPAANAGAAAGPAARHPAVGGAGMTYGRYGGAAADTAGEWRFRYNGYFRAPMNLGFGSRTAPFIGQSKTTISNLQVPGREFYSWQSTPNAQGPWTEMFFGYGNGVVESKIAVQAFNLSDPSFNDIDEQGAQIGISQAFVSIT